MQESPPPPLLAATRRRIATAKHTTIAPMGPVAIPATTSIIASGAEKDALKSKCAAGALIDTKAASAPAMSTADHDTDVVSTAAVAFNMAWTARAKSMICVAATPIDITMGVALPHRQVGAQGMQSESDPTRKAKTATVMKESDGATSGTAEHTRPPAKNVLNDDAQAVMLLWQAPAVRPLS